MVSRLLSLKPLTAIGLISYSLYLWHWPIIVAAEFALPKWQGPSLWIGLFGASIAFGYTSWRFVERPFRSIPQTVSSRRVLMSSAVVMLFVGSVGAVCVASAGLPTRWNAHDRQVAAYLDSASAYAAFRVGQCFAQDRAQTFDWDACLGSPDPSGKVSRLILLGDSHAADLWPGLHAALPNYDLRQVTAARCHPLIGRYSRGPEPCRGVMTRFVEQYMAGKHPAEQIFLSGRWAASEIPSIVETAKKMERTGAIVTIIGPVPEYIGQLPRLLITGGYQKAQDYRRRGIQELDEELGRRVEDAGLRYISLYKKLCSADACQVWAKKDVPLQFDYGHLTIPGSLYVGRLVVEAASLSDQNLQTSRYRNATS